MTQPSLLTDVPGRTMAQASREAFDRIMPTLTARELMMVYHVHNFCDEHQRPDVTGGELAQWTGIPVTSIRPRLTGACRKGWLIAGALRPSCAGEGRCHPYQLAVPIEAITRALEALT